MRVRNARFVLTFCCAAAFVVGCAPDDPPPEPEGPAVTAVVSGPVGHTLLLPAADPAELALTTSQQIFERSPVAVLAEGYPVEGDPEDDDVAAAAAVRAAQASAAEDLGAPALLVGGAVSAHGVTDELDRLGVQVAVVVRPASGPGDGGAAEQAAVAAGAAVVDLRSTALPGRSDEPGALSDAEASRLRADVESALLSGSSTGVEGLREVLALTDPQPGQEAAVATLRAAGAVDHEVPGGDIAASPESIERIDMAQALAVIGVGPSFGAAADFGWRVAAAERGDLLPTGTQHLLPARYVTTAGDRRDEPADVVERAASSAEAYADLEGGPVVPTVVVQASARAGHPGEDGDWVAEEPLAELEPLVDAALAADQYVLLDVGAGASTLLEEVEPLTELLRRPGVGVALHPEQRRSDGGLPPGQVPVDEVEAVITYIEGVVTNHGLPPTTVVVHQTRPESVVDRERLADVAAATDAVEIVLAADRTGGPTTTEWVWGRVTDDVPDGVHAGWAGPVYPPTQAADLVPTDPAPLFVAGS
ncbi:hypothetical protein GCM10009718_27560 [Isoptericola halotolerans]|uniref:Lipoprotein n=1 Tax=Isoptericola halotolerans TaxID=300560 RepID=A0ABX2A731_9MICO|nr:hypothetical protein [Isoptericola halotolerans]NOV97393.1 hypothetical protein [Isoptericola halotolerans]